MSSNYKEKIFMSPHFEHLRSYVESINEASSFTPQEKVFEGRNRIYRHIEQNTPLAVKCFSVPNIVNRVAYSYIRAGKARRSFVNTLKLQQMGINVPAPVGVREIYRDGFLAESFYISLFIDNLHEVRQWHTNPESDKIVEGVASMMAKLHTEGIYFRDFSPGNILYDDNWNFYLVDVNRMNFDCHDPRVLFRNFRAIHDDINEVIRLAEVYSSITPFTNIDMREIVEAARDNKIDYINEKKWHKLFKRIIRH